MHRVLGYDVTDDNRRRRLYNYLQGFLKPVQKSVFEGGVPTRVYPDLLRTVAKTIDHGTDSVRIYHLCRGCRQLTDHIGTAFVVPHGPEDVII